MGVGLLRCVVRLRVLVCTDDLLLVNVAVEKQELVTLLALAP